VSSLGHVRHRSPSPWGEGRSRIPQKDETHLDDLTAPPCGIKTRTAEAAGRCVLQVLEAERNVEMVARGAACALAT
jgi:hypothetical protein